MREEHENFGEVPDCRCGAIWEEEGGNKRRVADRERRSVEEHHKDVQAHRLLGDLHIVVGNNLLTKPSQRVAQKNGSKNQQDSDPDVERHNDDEQPGLGVVRDADELGAQALAKKGSSAAGQGDKRDGAVVDVFVLLLADARLFTALEETGDLDSDDPVLEAEQPVNDDREEEKQEDGR